MKGLDISRAFYSEYGLPMLKRDFPAERGRIAVGLIGEGSECLGYDDAVSRDHDFDAGFCLFVTQNDYDIFGFRLERAYEKLPREYMGLTRGLLSPVGGARRGVIVIEEFCRKFFGMPTAPKTNRDWLYLPSSSLAAAASGALFADPLGVMSEIRAVISRGYPEDVLRKRLAGHLILAAQAGQYNYPRAIRREDRGAAQLSIFEFVRHAVSAIYLLNRRFEPFYKWAFRGLRELPLLGDMAELLLLLLELDNTPAHAEAKRESVEYIAGELAAALRESRLSDAAGAELEGHAYAVQNGIADSALRNSHIMDAV